LQLDPQGEEPRSWQEFGALLPEFIEKRERSNRIAYLDVRPRAMPGPNLRVVTTNGRQAAALVA